MRRMSWAGRWIASPLLAGVVFAATAGTASALEIYKWVDEKGTTHYSDVKPSGVKWELMPERTLSVIPGNRIGAEAARAAEREQATTHRRSATGLPDLDDARARADRREQLLQDCQLNNGTDCRREVDTELQAEALQEGRGVIHLAPPPVNATPAPAPSPAPLPNRASALR